MAGVEFKWRGGEFNKILQREMEKRLKTVGEVVKSEIVRSMNVSGRSITAAAKHGTGPIRSREMLRVGERKRVYIFRSLPGEIPHVQTAMLRRSIQWDLPPGGETGADRVRIGSPLKYAKALEYGTHKMAARPFLRPGLLKSIPQIQRILTAKLPDK